MGPNIGRGRSWSGLVGGLVVGLVEEDEAEEREEALTLPQHQSHLSISISLTLVSASLLPQHELSIRISIGFTLASASVLPQHQH